MEVGASAGMPETNACSTGREYLFASGGFSTYHYGDALEEPEKWTAAIWYAICHNETNI